MTNKKAFTLIEIVIALIIASVASMYVIKTIQQNDFNEAIVDLQDNIYEVINKGVINPNGGYASGIGRTSGSEISTEHGTYCSPSLNYTDLSTVRLHTCLDWQDYTLTSSDELISRGLMGNYGGCMMEFTEGNTPLEFDVFVDCSNVNYNERSLNFVEDAVRFTLETTLQGIVKEVHEDAININSTTGGTSDDGLIRVTYEL